MEFWFRTEDPNAGLFCVVDANLGGGGHDRHIHLTGGNVRIRTWSGPGVEVSEGLNLADGTWHHIAHVISYELGGQFVYVDGELVIEGVKDMSDFDWQLHMSISGSPTMPSASISTGRSMNFAFGISPLRRRKSRRE